MLILLLLVLIPLSLVLGSANTSLQEVFSSLIGRGHDQSITYIVTKLRLPRILCALLCGASLSISGVVFQAVLQNSMADPFILGVSSGGSLGAAIAVSLGVSSLTGFSLLGSMFSALLILCFASHHPSQTRLILSGVAINYLFSSLMTLLMFLNHQHYERIFFWTLGSFGASTYLQFLGTACAFAVAFIPLLFCTKELDMLLMDTSSALSMGLNVRKYQSLFLGLGTIAVAPCVANFGVIGFIGLLSPHLCRLVLGPKHKRLLPSSALMGSLLLLGSDTLARLILPSGEMPVGVVTSLLGTPLLIFMLKKSRYNYG